MILVVQPQLAERTVFEAVRKDALLAPNYEKRFAACHEYRSEDARERAFAEMHEEWFTELGFRALIAGLVNEHRHFRYAVGRLMVVEAPMPKAQTAELYGDPGQYTVILAVCPSILLQRETFEYWARHEFLHVEDMLDPAFGYDARQRPGGATPAGRQLMQDRFAVLWAISVDSRLAQRGLIADGVRERRRAEFERAFGLSGDESPGRAFEEFWEQGRWFAPTHSQLLDWARGGSPGRQEVSTSDAVVGPRPAAGAPCPLCGFATFEWAPAEDVQGLSEAIGLDFSAWRTEHGACGRCAEVYRSARTPQVSGV